MKCPVCVETGQTSKLHSADATFSTAMGGSERYYDEDGALHHHDVNTHTTGYWCSNGHRLMYSGKPNCPAPGCGYGGREWTVVKSPTEVEL